MAQPVVEVLGHLIEDAQQVFADCRLGLAACRLLPEGVEGRPRVAPGAEGLLDRLGIGIVASVDRQGIGVGFGRRLFEAMDQGREPFDFVAPLAAGEAAQRFAGRGAGMALAELAADPAPEAIIGVLEGAGPDRQQPVENLCPLVVGYPGIGLQPLGRRRRAVDDRGPLAQRRGVFSLTPMSEIRRPGFDPSAVVGQTENPAVVLQHDELVVQDA